MDGIGQGMTGGAAAASVSAPGAALGPMIAARARELLADRSASRDEVASQEEADLEEHLASFARLARAA
jgi:hypothetical protein